MRGSAVPDLSVASSLTTSSPGLKENSNVLALLRSNDVASLIKELDQSLHDLRLPSGGDHEMLSSIAQDVGLEGLGMKRMRETIDLLPDLLETVDGVSTMLQQEILPIVADTRDKLAENLPESERHLAGLFDSHFHSDDETSQSQQSLSHISVILSLRR